MTDTEKIAHSVFERHANARDTRPHRSPKRSHKPTALAPLPWTAPSAAVYAADGEIVCSLGTEEIAAAFRRRGDTNGSMIADHAQFIAHAVNCHNQLLEAVQQAIFAIPTTHGAYETVRAVIAKVEAQS